MAGKRFINKQIPILSENITIRLKAIGGMFFVDENGEESKTFSLGRKYRKETDEVSREQSERARYKGFEMFMIPVALPVTVLSKVMDGAGTLGGFALSNRPNFKIPMVEDYILKSIWSKIIVNQFAVWRSLAHTKADDIDIPAIDTARDEITLEMVEDRANSSFVYDSMFVDFIEGQHHSVTDADNILQEIIVQNADEEGGILDLDLEFKINFYGELDFQILNT